MIGKSLKETNLSHHDSPVAESTDAHLLTMVLDEEYKGPTLGITDADLKTETEDDDVFYDSILGDKSSKNDFQLSTPSRCPIRIQIYVCSYPVLVLCRFLV